MPRRRTFLRLCCASPLAAAFTRAEAVDTSCLKPLPPALAQHELVAAAFDGLDFAQVWDAHAHLIGIGDSASGAWAGTDGASWRHPIERMRRIMIERAACVADAPEGTLDLRYIERLNVLLAAFPPGFKMLLLAFDLPVDENGREQPERASFYVPDRYAAAVAGGYPQRLEWAASVHPYRPDAIARLRAARAAGARAVKWLPSSMGMDPSSPRCDPFYAELAATRLPLIVHVGEEKAAPGLERPELNNPLLLRRPLEQGVRVILAHAATLGRAVDLEAKAKPEVDAFTLAARLLDEPRYAPYVAADISAVFQRNREPAVQRQIVTRRDWHGRLLHGSDYPLPGLGFVYYTERFVKQGWLPKAEAQVLDEIRPHNPLLYEFMLKRRLRVDGVHLPPATFHTRGFFAAATA